MMKNKALKIILFFNIAGALFSGFLTVQKLTTNTCILGEACQKVGPLPACAYGLIIYLIILITSIAGLRSNEKKILEEP